MCVCVRVGVLTELWVKASTDSVPRQSCIIDDGDSMVIDFSLCLCLTCENNRVHFHASAACGLLR